MSLMIRFKQITGVHDASRSHKCRSHGRDGVTGTTRFQAWVSSKIN